MAKIECPNKAYSGTSAGIKFANGVAETDDMNAISWFKKWTIVNKKDTILQTIYFE